MAKRRRKHRKGVGGLKGLKGLGTLGNLKTGLGRDVVPPLVAGILTAGTTLGLRAWVKPTPGAMSAKLYQYAPLIGAGVGALGSLALYYMGGAGPALAGALGSVLTGAALTANEQLLAKQGLESIQAAGLLSASVPAPDSTAGLGAVLPEYAPLDGIVMEKVNGVQGLGANAQHFGENVNLSGTVNQSAFGTAPFGGN